MLKRISGVEAGAIVMALWVIAALAWFGYQAFMAYQDGQVYDTKLQGQIWDAQAGFVTEGGK